MADDQLIQSVNDVFIESFEIPAEKITPEAEIFGDLGLDSLDVVDLVAAIQKKFNVQVRDDERVRSIRTMQNLYDYLHTLQQESASAPGSPAPAPGSAASASHGAAGGVDAAGQAGSADDAGNAAGGASSDQGR